jgi:hypothetical protein
MNLLERLLNLFSGRRNTLLGAISQPNPMEYLYAVRARTFLKLTGRPLTTVDSFTKSKSETSTSDITKNLSPSRRLLRKGVE